jgi:hypothetical protein
MITKKEIRKFREKRKELYSIKKHLTFNLENSENYEEYTKLLRQLSLVNHKIECLKNRRFRGSEFEREKIKNKRLRETNTKPAPIPNLVPSPDHWTFGSYYFLYNHKQFDATFNTHRND